MLKAIGGLLNQFRAKPHAPILVNLGCGRHFHPDWVNVDCVAHGSEVLVHDLQKPLPFEDSSCAAVYSSHVLEHLPHTAVPSFLKECHRILVPGGIIRIVVPDFESIVRLYLSNLEGALAGDKESAARYEWILLELLDQLVREKSGGEMLQYWRQDPMPAERFVLERMGREVLQAREYLRNTPPPPNGPIECDPSAAAKFRSGGEPHKWMYDRWSLRLMLKQADFSAISTIAADHSRIPDFNRYGLDLHSDGSIRKPDSLFMEAEKPSKPTD